MTTTVASDAAGAHAPRPSARSVGSRPCSMRAPPNAAAAVPSDRHPDLHGREEPLGLVAQRLDRERAAVLAADELAQPRLADA